tara:strand:+ start:834 stop:1304 length:471 start_codon:yes stop_codon:yes gene_type:complete
MSSISDTEFTKVVEEWETQVEEWGGDEGEILARVLNKLRFSKVLKEIRLGVGASKVYLPWGRKCGHYHSNARDARDSNFCWDCDMDSIDEDKEEWLDMVVKANKMLDAKSWEDIVGYPKGVYGSYKEMIYGEYGEDSEQARDISKSFREASKANGF